MDGPTVAACRSRSPEAAGFIGSHTVTALTGAGHAVRVLDAELPSAHRTVPRIPPGVDWRHADARDRAAVTDALRGVDAVCHQAAMVGFGKDFADAPDYVGCNDLRRPPHHGLLTASPRGTGGKPQVTFAEGMAEFAATPLRAG
jgi:dTDP-L-rhamnose 4-epimerase